MRFFLNKENYFGSTPIMLAAGKGNLRLVTWMVDNRADMWAQRRDGVDALYLAAQAGSIEVVNYIIRVDKSLINRQTCLGRTPIFAAAVKGRLSVANILYNNGANLNHKDDVKSTPLRDSNSEYFGTIFTSSYVRYSLIYSYLFFSYQHV